jgi:hypothetical protein
VYTSNRAAENGVLIVFTFVCLLQTGVDLSAKLDGTLNEKEKALLMQGPHRVVKSLTILSEVIKAVSVDCLLLNLIKPLVVHTEP